MYEIWRSTGTIIVKYNVIEHWDGSDFVAVVI